LLWRGRPIFGSIHQRFGDNMWRGRLAVNGGLLQATDAEFLT